MSINFMTRTFRNGWNKTINDDDDDTTHHLVKSGMLAIPAEDGTNLYRILELSNKVINFNCSNTWSIIQACITMSDDNEYWKRKKINI